MRMIPTLCRCLLAVGLWWSQAQQGETAQFEKPSESPADPDRIDAVFTPPSPETIPPGRQGERIRMGYEIVVHTQPRPDVPGKQFDWPKGGKPDDLPY